MIIGIDVGGANTKISSADGSIADSYYLPLWKKRDIKSMLEDFSAKSLLKNTAEGGLRSKYASADAVGVVMTGELADCFASKDNGVRFIADAILSVFDDVHFLDTNGTFVSDASGAIAATNWVASANLVGIEFPDALFMDIGSTTSDIIPIVDGVPRAAKTDFERLKRDELVYSGILRTNVATILDRVILDGPCRISSELFAITADVYSVLGDISEADYTCETPDGAGKDVESAMRRLARVVCCDMKEICNEELAQIAKQIKEYQVQNLVDAALNVYGRFDLDTIIAGGLGEFLAEDVARRLGLRYIGLSNRYGKRVSSVFPAYAVARLLETSRRVVPSTCHDRNMGKS